MTKPTMGWGFPIWTSSPDDEDGREQTRPQQHEDPGSGPGGQLRLPLDREGVFRRVLRRLVFFSLTRPVTVCLFRGLSLLGVSESDDDSSTVALRHPTSPRIQPPPGSAAAASDRGIDTSKPATSVARPAPLPILDAQSEVSIRSRNSKCRASRAVAMGRCSICQEMVYIIHLSLAGVPRCSN